MKGLPRPGKLSFLLVFLLLPLFSVGPLFAQIEGLEIVAPEGESQKDGERQEGQVNGEVSQSSVSDETSPVSSRNSHKDPRASVKTDSSFSLKQGGEASFEVSYDFPPGFYQTKNREMFTISFPPSSPVEVSEIHYPEGRKEEGLINYYGTAVLEVYVEARENVQSGEYRVPITASYQLCDEAGTCFFPQDVEKEIAVTLTAEGGTEGTAGAEKTDNATGGRDTNLLDLLKYLLFALIGGILLNVMPCVLPVLSIRALNLVKQSKNNRRELLFGSLLYSAGIVLSLLALAAVVTALKLSGELVGWGFQFQNPGFVVFLSIVVFVFSLSLFDVYVFQAPTMNGAIGKAGEKGYVGSFFNGIIAVLLATPCTAPLLGTALGFAFSQPPLVIFAMFIVVGIGFALPFLLIGIWPAAIRKLPKPGAWMNTFKELMGFVLLATVLYLLSILRYQVGSEGILRVILFLLLLAFFLWIYGKTAKPTTGRKRKWIILGLFIILSVSAADRILVFEAPEDGLTSNTLREGWEEFEPDKLERYKENGEPVFVVFSAQWCTVCKMNEETVLHTETADTIFEERDIKVLYGDFTNEAPIIEEWIRFYGRAGVPVYAFYPPGEDSYELLPEVLTGDILKKRLK